MGIVVVENFSKSFTLFDAEDVETPDGDYSRHVFGGGKIGKNIHLETSIPLRGNATHRALALMTFAVVAP